MTDDMDIVELTHALKNMATLTRTFYTNLKEEGFSDKEALTLTVAWLKATSGANQ